jgi:hypothetical protein
MHDKSAIPVFRLTPGSNKRKRAIKPTSSILSAQPIQSVVEAA